MDLDLTEEQELLRETTERFFQEHGSMTLVRQWADTLVPVPDDYYQKAAALGWFSLLSAEEIGSEDSRLGLSEAAIIAEERGRTLQPGPFIPTSVVIAALGRSSRSDEANAVLSHLVNGEASATWAADWTTSPFEASARLLVDVTDDGARISGQEHVVEYAAEADWILVSGRDQAGKVTQALVPTRDGAVTTEHRRNLDVTRSVGSVHFNDVRFKSTMVVGDVGTTDGDLELQRDIAACLITAETVGAMDALFELTRAYALERVAFGRTIGSFQAIKHQLADLSLALESSKAIAAVATRAVDGQVSFASAAASVAKAWVSEAAMTVGQGCFQIFGGVAFTWEHDCHLYFRRLTTSGLRFGSASWHRERLCAL
jgi:alkylation response protein AidB-like acyl-CoA dehydrogenase